MDKNTNKLRRRPASSSVHFRYQPVMMKVMSKANVNLGTLHKFVSGTLSPFNTATLQSYAASHKWPGLLEAYVLWLGKSHSPSHTLKSEATLQAVEGNIAHRLVEWRPRTSPGSDHGDLTKYFEPYSPCLSKCVQTRRFPCSANRRLCLSHALRHYFTLRASVWKLQKKKMGFFLKE